MKKLSLFLFSLLCLVGMAQGQVRYRLDSGSYIASGTNSLWTPANINTLYQGLLENSGTNLLPLGVLPPLPATILSGGTVAGNFAVSGTISGLGGGITSIPWTGVLKTGAYITDLVGSGTNVGGVQTFLSLVPGTNVEVWSSKLDTLANSSTFFLGLSSSTSASAIDNALGISSVGLTGSYSSLLSVPSETVGNGLTGSGVVGTGSLTVNTGTGASQIPQFGTGGSLSVTGTETLESGSYLTGGAESVPYTVPAVSATGTVTINSQPVPHDTVTLIDSSTNTDVVEMLWPAGLYSSGTISTNACCFDGTNVWMAGGTQLQETATNGTVLGTYTLPASIATTENSLAYDGTSIWAISGTSAYRVSTSGVVTGTFGVETSPATAGNIMYAGGYIWVNYVGNLSTGGANIVKVNPATGAVLGTYTVSGMGLITSMTFDGTNLWVGDFVTGGSYSNYNVIKVSPTGSVLGTYVSCTVGGGEPTYGLAFDGTNIWTYTSFGSGTSYGVTEMNTSGTILSDYTSSGTGGFFYPGSIPSFLPMSAYGGNLCIFLRSNNPIRVGVVNIGTGAQSMFTYAPAASNYVEACFDGTNVWSSTRADYVEEFNPATATGVVNASSTLSSGGNKPATISVVNTTTTASNLAAETGSLSFLSATSSGAVVTIVQNPGLGGNTTISTSDSGAISETNFAGGVASYVTPRNSIDPINRELWNETGATALLSWAGGVVSTLHNTLDDGAGNLTAVHYYGDASAVTVGGFQITTPSSVHAGNALVSDSSYALIDPATGTGLIPDGFGNFVTTTGTITAAYFSGNGAGLSGITVTETDPVFNNWLTGEGYSSLGSFYADVASVASNAGYVTYSDLESINISIFNNDANYVTEGNLSSYLQSGGEANFDSDLISSDGYGDLTVTGNLDIEGTSELFVGGYEVAASGDLYGNGSNIVAVNLSNQLQVVTSLASAGSLVPGLDVYTGAGGDTLTLPDPSTAGQTIYIKSQGSGAETVGSNSGAQIFTTSAQATITMNPGDSATFISDGTYWNKM